MNITVCKTVSVMLLIGDIIACCIINNGFYSKASAFPNALITPVKNKIAILRSCCKETVVVESKKRVPAIGICYSPQNSVAFWRCRLTRFSTHS